MFVAGLAVLLFANDNLGGFVQLGTAKQSTDAAYSLLKKDMEFGTTDSYYAGSKDGIPGLFQDNISATALIGFAPSSSYVSGVGRDDPVLCVAGFYDDSAGATNPYGASPEDAQVRSTFRYDGLVDDNSEWEWLGSYDSNGDGIFNAWWAEADLAKRDEKVWRRWVFTIPDPEFTHDVGVGGISGSYLFYNNWGHGPEGISFFSLVRLSDADVNVLADNFSDWAVTQKDNADPSVTVDSGIMNLTFSFDNTSYTEWFTITPFDGANPYSLDLGEGVPQELYMVNFLVRVKVIDTDGGNDANSKIKLRAFIEDKDGETFMVGKASPTTCGQWEYLTFTVGGPEGTNYITFDGWGASVNKKVDFPIKFRGIRVIENGDSVSENNMELLIDKVLVRADRTPPVLDFLRLASPFDGQVFDSLNITFEWSPTEDLFSGMEGISDAYRVEVSEDPSFSKLVAYADLPQVYGENLTATLNLPKVGTYYWRIRVKDKMGNVAYSSIRKFYCVEKPKEDVPFIVGIAEAYAYPNPFHPGRETLRFTTKYGQVLGYKIVDVFGREIASDDSDSWDGTNTEGQRVKPGLYLYWVRIKKSDGTISLMGPGKLVVGR